MGSNEAVERSVAYTPYTPYTNTGIKKDTREQGVGYGVVAGACVTLP